MDYLWKSPFENGHVACFLDREELGSRVRESISCMSFYMLKVLNYVNICKCITYYKLKCKM